MVDLRSAPFLGRLAQETEATLRAEEEARRRREQEQSARKRREVYGLD